MLARSGIFYLFKTMTVVEMFGIFTLAVSSKLLLNLVED